MNDGGTTYIVKLINPENVEILRAVWLEEPPKKICIPVLIHQWSMKNPEADLKEFMGHIDYILDGELDLGDLIICTYSRG